MERRKHANGIENVKLMHILKGEDETECFTYGGIFSVDLMSLVVVILIKI